MSTCLCSEGSLALGEKQKKGHPDLISVPALLAVPLNPILNGSGAGARRLAAPFIEELVGLRRLLVLQAAESVLEKVSSDDLEVVAFNGSFFARPAQAGSIEIRIQKGRPHA
jgi:hypothetical protein